MPCDQQPDQSPKRLRDFCVNIHQENIAFLLRAALPDFPPAIVDEFFTGPKLNKPSGPDDREWTDIVRLALIAFAPDGSEPARLRGKPIPRYVRDYPFEPQRTDAAPPGTLVLYPTQHTSPLLKEIAVSLAVSELKIRSRAWLSRYLCDPFPLRSLSISLERVNSGWKAVPGLEADLQEIFAVLPEGLEELDIELNASLPFSDGGINRLRSLKKLTIRTAALPKGLDFSANTSLQSLRLQVASQGSAAIRGLGMLPVLQDLHIECEVPFRYERAHGYWQKRLPALFAAEHVSTLPEANTWIDSLRDHRNRQEIHREIRSTPQAAWNLAKKQGRSALRPAPKCPWWPYVFSQRSQTRVGSDGRIAIGSQRLRLEQPPATLVTRCLHPDGYASVLLRPPHKDTRPTILLRLETLT